jgi:hypothetical protein
MYRLDKGGTEKVNFFKQKQVLGALLRHFFTIWDNKKEGGGV